MTRAFALAALLIPLSASIGAPTSAGEPAAAGAAAEGELVLDTCSFWRCHLTLRPPLFAGEAAKAPAGRPARPHTPLPPEGWPDPEFDDSGWWRDAGPFFGGHGSGSGRAGMTQQIGLLCLRGKFGVTDPGRVKPLRLSVAFRGGLVVYLNGKEAGRSHMPQGALAPLAAAEEYPPEAFFTQRESWKMSKEQKAARYGLRLRRAEFSLPVPLLRKGTNVLALEIHRAPMKPLPTRWDSRNMFNFSTCGLDEVSLRTSAQGAVTANVVRPEGFQVWNADLLQLVTPVDYGDPHEKLGPVRIAGTCNGEFSGQVVASSDAPIKGLKAEMGDLLQKGGKGVLPAAQVRVRYPLRAGLKTSYSYLHPRYPAKNDWYQKRWGCWLGNFDALADAPPAEVPVYDASGSVRAGSPHAAGAVQPVWVTVRVPADAAPGDYAGRLTVRAEGAAPVEVPVEIRVSGWKLPEPRSFRTVVDMAQSPETLALYYDVPLWSDRHFALIDRTFQLLGTVGSDVVYVPLIGETNLGNEHSMVQWAKQPDGSYTCDFSVAGRYLDLAEKHMGRPRIVCFQVWDYHLGGDITFGRMYSGKRGTGTESAVDGVLVSLASAPGAKPQTVRVPHYLSPKGRETWKPLMDGLCQFVRKRGLAGSATLGMGGDILPNKDVVEFWRAGFPDSKWMIQGHGGAGHGSVSTIPADLYGVPVNYVSIVYGARFALGDPERGRMYGWKGQKLLNTLFARGLFLNGDVAPPAASRLIAEWNIEGGQAGIGRLTADFFRIPNKNGRGSSWLPKRYPQSSWHNASVRPPLLAPGPQGALSTTRFDLTREGIQECEARIFLEKALTDEKLRARLGEGLAARLQGLLDERTRANMWVFEYDHVIDYNIGARHTLMGGAVDINWYAASGWQERSTKLFAAAAAAARALGIETAPPPPAPRPAGKPAPAPAPAPTAEPAKPPGPAAQPGPSPEKVCRGWWSLAMSYKRMGRADKAREYLRRIIKEHPQTEYAARARRELARM